MGLGVTRLPAAPLPFPTAGALRWDNQAALHPLAYLGALADAFARAGGRIAEETQVVEIDDADLCRVITDRGTVLARDVIVAAHVPISNRICAARNKKPDSSSEFASFVAVNSSNVFIWLACEIPTADREQPQNQIGANKTVNAVS
jgi:hypothetical protein